MSNQIYRPRSSQGLNGVHPAKHRGCVVAAIDGSPIQQAVTAEAVSQARRLGTVVSLLHAASAPPLRPASAGAVKTGDLPQLFTDNALIVLADAMATVPADLRGDMVTDIGQAAAVILAMAKHVDAKMLVIGRRGYNVMVRVLDTTAAKVVNLAPCSVVVVSTLTMTETAETR